MDLIDFVLQELKIRKGTGRGRGRRSKRELDEERDVEDYNVDEGDFGFVEVLDQIALYTCGEDFQKG